MIFLTGCIGRLWETEIIDAFLQKYFKVYDEQYELFSQLAAIGAFVGLMLANLHAGHVIAHYGPKYDFTIPLLITLKALWDLCNCFAIFFQ